jgi:ethanolamine ammonia-lyase large subunit
MDTLLTSLGAAGCTFFITVPGSDDVMLGYQSAAYHDALYVREVLGTRPAPEFEAWLQRMGLVGADDRVHELPIADHPVAGLLEAA